MTNPLTKGLRPVHPGEMLREDILPAVARPKVEIARLLGISRQTLYDILNEKQPVTPRWHCASRVCLAAAPKAGSTCSATTT